MCMYQNYLLENGFWSKKNTNSQIFLKHDEDLGGIYAIIKKEGFNKGIEIIFGEEKHFFTNFSSLDSYFDKLQASRREFKLILRRKSISNKLRKLEL
ncbi:MAG: hypothetical protein ACFFCV_18740 [Promethearchaeota archaeon]